jgi:hypothetical protein
MGGDNTDGRLGGWADGLARIIEKRDNGGVELKRISWIEPSRDRGCANEGGYFELCPIVRPNEISPLSIRMLNPQSGLLHTQALYVIGAPSRP